ncbi:MAG: prephenate dehydrogenase [Ruminococcaceae bacterium]|nr:prephenate dehydrogenase [Oscillospiraceae bacterium]
MKLNKDTDILIIGLGVIGGGYAKALTKQGFHIRTITEREEDIEYALAQGMIESGRTTVDEDYVRAADLIIFALYPHTFVEWLERYQHLFKSGALITDVTGVKSTLVAQIQEMLRPDVEFIAAHPMAGRERSGVLFSDDGVFRGANYIVTPTEKNSPEAIGTCRELGWLLGFSSVCELTPAEHDRMIAFLSQLTHCIAITLMTANTDEGLARYTGDSFRDLTRIAKINDEMWSELFLLNRDALLEQMDAFMAEFQKLRTFIADGKREEMREMMRESTERRSLFDKK